MPEDSLSFTLTNVLVPVADRRQARDIVVEAGQIAAIEPPAARQGRVLDAVGLSVLPAFVDNHVHYREPGLEQKEGFATGSQASARGGATTVLEIQNNVPYLDCVAAAEHKRALARGKAIIDVGFYASGHPRMLGAIGELARHCQALKIFMAGPKDLAIVLEDELRLAFERCAAADLAIVLHAEDENVIAQGLRRHRGEGAKSFSKARSPAAEIVAVERALELTAATGAKVHFFHVSTAGACERIAEAKQQGLPISASTCPHYLLFDDEDVARRGAVLKCNPSIKSAADRAALVAAVKSGVVDIVSTDHAPHALEEKQRPFDDAPSGIPSADLFMPLMLTLVRRGDLDLATVVNRCATTPARWHGYPDRGVIAVGQRADLVLVDPERAFTVRVEDFASKAKLSPYVGTELFGQPIVTLHRGRIVVDRRRS